MKRIILLFLLITTSAFAQRPRVQVVDTVKIWPNGAPNEFTIPKPNEGFIVFNAEKYKEALMEVYPAKEPNGTCVIMCPGGAYIMQSQTYEGRDLKDWFNVRGITYCMLQYRLPCGHSDVPLSDVQEAIRIMRSKGYTQIGIMGNSAGGHLAACAATLYTSPENKPDFQILMYPVITMEASYTNGLSRDALLGKNPTQALVDQYSCEKHINAQTPPAFIVLCSDDPDVQPKNSLVYYQGLIDNKVSATMHIYPTGGHGWGWKDSMIYKNHWVSAMEDWIRLFVKF